MLELLLSVLAAVRVFFRGRAEASLEVLALRQQVAVLKRKRPRPTLTRLDRVFWITLWHLWPRWADVLLIVKPETVVRWHRAGFRLYWRWRSRRRGGRPPITEETQTLIRRLATENPTWGAPRLHGELLKLGFDVSERVARYRRRRPRRGDSANRWAAFLANHREAIVACDFFTVPTLTFQLLWCFFVIEHRRRTILHVNVTREPTAAWVVQQLRDVFLADGPHRYILLDHDSTFDGNVIAFLKATGPAPTRTGRSGALAKRDRGALGGQLPARASRPHRCTRRTPSLSADSRVRGLPSLRPHSRCAGEGRPEAATDRAKTVSRATVTSTARVGGLQYRYSWRAAA